MSSIPCENILLSLLSLLSFLSKIKTAKTTIYAYCHFNSLQITNLHNQLFFIRLWRFTSLPNPLSPYFHRLFFNFFHRVRGSKKYEKLFIYILDLPCDYNFSWVRFKIRWWNIPLLMCILCRQIDMCHSANGVKYIIWVDWREQTSTQLLNGILIM